MMVIIVAHQMALVSELMNYVMVIAIAEIALMRITAVSFIYNDVIMTVILFLNAIFRE